MVTGAAYSQTLAEGLTQAETNGIKVNSYGD